MESLNRSGEVFKNVFPDYEHFRNWYLQTGLSDDENDVPKLRTFTLIFNEFSDNHICLSVDSFKCRFSNDLYTYYKEFEETTENIKLLMNLNDEDIAISGSEIINSANIPEEASSTSVEEVDFISNQQKTIRRKGKLQIRREQLSNKRTYTVKTFLNRFRHLFIKVISPSYNFVECEPEHD